MWMLASNAFALCHQPLAEHSCHVPSCIDPDAPLHYSCCFCCPHLHVVVVIVVVALVVVAATRTIVEVTPPVEPSRCHFPPRGQASRPSFTSCLAGFALPLITPMQLHVQQQADNDEKNLVMVLLQMELIGKVAAMVIACIECKPV
jgi:hypothetical protein